VGLNISPAPDSLFRLWLVISPEQEAKALVPPEVTPLERYGFTAVEWGVIID